MINELLLNIVNFLIIGSTIIYILYLITNRKNKITNSNSFNLVKDMLHDYNHINIIEGNSKVSFYDIQRKVVKLSKKDYYGDNLTSVSLSTIQTSISAIDDDKNNFINICKKIIPTLKILELLNLISLFINCISQNIKDAKIGIIIMIIILIVEYLYIGILDLVSIFVDNNINKVKEIKKSRDISNFVDKVILYNKIQFISQILIIIRFVAIILNM